MKYSEAFYQTLCNNKSSDIVDNYFKEFFYKHKLIIASTLDGQHSYAKEYKIVDEMLTIFHKSLRQTDIIPKTLMKALSEEELEHFNIIINKMNEASSSRTLWYQRNILSDNYIIWDNVLYNYIHYSTFVHNIFNETQKNLNILKEFNKAERKYKLLCER